MNGAVVKQRSGCQETTMAKAGTLPEGSFNKDLTSTGNLACHQKHSLNDAADDVLTELRGQQDNVVSEAASLSDSE